MKTETKKRTGSGKRASALLLTTIMLFVILSMVASLTYVTVMEQKMSQKTKSSVGAFYSSESGIEWALNKIATNDGAIKIGSIPGVSFNSDGSAQCPFGGCSVYFLKSNGDIVGASELGTVSVAEIKAVRSVGTQAAGDVTQRAIEAAVAAGGPRYTSASTSISNGSNTSFTHNLGYIPNCLWKSDNADQLISVKSIDTTTITLQSATLGGSANVVVYCW